MIPNGIDTERYCPNREAGQQVRAEWSINEQQTLVGLVGRLDPMKDHPVFLRAAALLAQEQPDVCFVCVGDGPRPYNQELQALGEALGLGERLIWAGARSDMPAVYNAFDIASSSSSYGEGFSNAIAEAMACGVPCVVTDVGDSARIVGDMGVVVPPKHPEALASGWKVALAKGRREMALKARLRIVENFGVKRLIEQTEAAIWPKA